MPETTVYSWLKVFKKRTVLKRVTNYNMLIRYLKVGYKVSGSFHSYNRKALHEKTIKLDGHFRYIKYNPMCKTVRVGGAVRVREIMEYLLKNGRRLPNSGNHFTQTFSGAAITGTHGFGEHASLADSIMMFEGIFKEKNKYIKKICDDVSLLRSKELVALTFLILETKPLQSFKVTNCVCSLDDIEFGKDGIPKAYAVLPFSNPYNPVSLIAMYENNNEVVVDGNQPRRRTRPWKWWRVKTWWFVDRWFPPLRKWVQRSLTFLKQKEFVTYTHPEDYDALYDPDPGLAGQRGSIKFTRWAYRPTYTCFNIALFSKPEDTKEIIRFAIHHSEKLKYGLLRCFIGVRELQDKSRADYTGNAEGPVDAIDFYCSPKNVKHLYKLQKMIQENFNVRPHYGKTLFR